MSALKLINSAPAEVGEASNGVISSDYRPSNERGYR
jgi:hypothetical protein